MHSDVLHFTNTDFNTLLQAFNWPKQVHYIPTDKINASIRIWRILNNANIDQLCHITT